MIENRKIDLPKAFNLTSEQIYAKVKAVCDARYEVKLPENVW